MGLRTFGVIALGSFGLAISSVPALAQTAANTVAVDPTTMPVDNGDDGDEGKWGLLGLLGLAGLLGLKRRDNHVHVDRTNGTNSRL